VKGIASTTSKPTTFLDPVTFLKKMHNFKIIGPPRSGVPVEALMGVKDIKIECYIDIFGKLINSAFVKLLIIIKIFE